NIPRIKRKNRNHRCNARFFITVKNSTLNRVCAAIFRQKRRMEVNCGEFRNIEHILCQNLAESKRNKEIRLNFSQFFEKIRVFSNGFRLKNRNIMTQSELFYG